MRLLMQELKQQLKGSVCWMAGAVLPFASAVAQPASQAAATAEIYGAIAKVLDVSTAAHGDFKARWKAWRRVKCQSSASGRGKVHAAQLPKPTQQEGHARPARHHTGLQAHNITLYNVP